MLGVDPYELVRVQAERAASVVVALPDGSRTTISRLDALPHDECDCATCAQLFTPRDPVPAIPSRPPRPSSTSRAPHEQPTAAPVVVRRDPSLVEDSSTLAPHADERAAASIDAEALYMRLLDLVCGEGVRLATAITQIAYEHDLSSADVEEHVLPVVDREDAFELLGITPGA